MGPAATGHVAIRDARQIGPDPRPVVSGGRPDVSGLGLSALRIKNRRARLVHEELGRPL